MNRDDPENIEEYDFYNQNHNNAIWWRAMKARMQHKSSDQIALDRQLIESIGYRSNINLENVKNLIERGAKVDHWVGLDDRGSSTHSSRYNAIQLAAFNSSDEATEAIRIFVQSFPNFMNRDIGGWDSILARSMRSGYVHRTNVIISTKTAENPIYSFLTMAKSTKDEKNEIIKNIVLGFHVKLSYFIGARWQPAKASFVGRVRLTSK